MFLFISIKIKKWYFILFLSFIYYSVFAQRPFTLVIDPGHGGKDKGAIGSYKYSIYEKNIALEVAKKLGRLIEHEYGKKVKVIYTRKTDIFVPLKKRADIANKSKADLFISIHCNSSNPNHTPYGSETYVLGLHRSADNFEVAKRENSVILLEENYKVTYEGFDPSSPESVIGLSLMQNSYLDQSIHFADAIQKSFVHTGRKSRGVKQAGFLVLRETVMPSVLVEIGFLSNLKDRRYINSSGGQSKIANAIFQSFKSYKKEFDKKTTLRSSSVVKQKSINPSSDKKKPNSEKEDLIYKVQILSSRKKVRTYSYNFNGLKGVKRIRNNNGIYIYTYGKTTNYSTIIKKKKEARAKGYKDAFVIALKEGERVQISGY